jgi:hypothetical protein
VVQFILLSKPADCCHTLLSLICMAFALNWATLGEVRAAAISSGFGSKLVA